MSASVYRGFTDSSFIASAVTSYSHKAPIFCCGFRFWASPICRLISSKSVVTLW
jgi:hypothetical protein